MMCVCMCDGQWQKDILKILKICINKQNKIKAMKSAWYAYISNHHG